MPERAFARARHRRVVRALAAFDRKTLAAAGCYFGGGTRIVLELDEYRESADLDFLCAEPSRYRTLRSAVSDASLGPILAKPLRLARDVRADRYGIRTFLEVDGQPLKLEIILEARVPLVGTRVDAIPVDCLDRASCFAEKFLANADRWNDESVASRDLVDLAFMMANWPPAEVGRGLATAVAAYGAAATTSLDRAIDKMRKDKRYARACLRTLLVDDVATFEKGLQRLARKAWRRGAK
jgi:hypothetical protein